MTNRELGRWAMDAATWLLLSVAMVGACGCGEYDLMYGCAKACKENGGHMAKWSQVDGCVCAAAATDGGSK